MTITDTAKALVAAQSQAQKTYSQKCDLARELLRERCDEARTALLNTRAWADRIHHPLDDGYAIDKAITMAQQICDQAVIVAESRYREAVVAAGEALDAELATPWAAHLAAIDSARKDLQP